jgi:hypothetical protein
MANGLVRSDEGEGQKSCRVDQFLRNIGEGGADDLLACLCLPCLGLEGSFAMAEVLSGCLG